MIFTIYALFDNKNNMNMEHGHGVETSRGCKQYYIIIIQLA